MSCCTGVVPLTRSLGGDCASWLVTPINPRSTATKTAANRTHGTVRSQGRIQTSAAATAVKTTAKTVASRTVLTTEAFAVTPAKTWSTEAGAVAAQMAKAAARPNGTRAVIRSHHRIGSRSRSVPESVRSTHPANSTQMAVATVIMLRLWRR